MKTYRRTIDSWRCYKEPVVFRLQILDVCIELCGHLSQKIPFIHNDGLNYVEPPWQILFSGFADIGLYKLGDQGLRSKNFVWSQDHNISGGRVRLIENVLKIKWLLLKI